MILAIQRSNVRSAQSTAAGVAEEIQPPEIVGLAEWILIRWMIGYWEEF